MDRQELKAVIEGIIYVSEEPVTVKQILSGVKGSEKGEVRAALDELIEAGQTPGRGVEIRQIAGGYRMSTKPEHHEAVRAFVRTQRPPLRLSHQSLVTLAVIAYKQPVTGPEIKAIRAVDPQGPIHTLLDKGLIEIAGRKEVVGRPILYRTTRDFLMRFGLKDVKELPSEKEFEELARAALVESGDLFDEPEPPESLEETAEVSETAETAEVPAPEETAS